MNSLPEHVLRYADVDLSDLPWHLPLERWQGNCSRLEEAPHGRARHPVVFINDRGVLYALKELPIDQARYEYEALLEMERLRLPAVTPVGYLQTATSQGRASVLVTRYLEYSIPYRTLFMTAGLERYRDTLLDALAGLLVQLHLAGVYWGDCSLSNALFRRDAGALQAYLVDAETAEIHTQGFSPTLRHHDLEILEENVNGDIADLDAASMLPTGLPLIDTGAHIRLRYQQLWEEITHEDVIAPDEHYRIQERIKALNQLGYSVGEVDLHPTAAGSQLRLRVVVTDRNFHRDQLHSLTGLIAEENQAQKVMNEIQELRASLSSQTDRSTPLSVAAYHWLTQYFQPTVASLQAHTQGDLDNTELYCQVLEHKWFLSESSHRDVGHQIATADYLENILLKQARDL